MNAGTAVSANPPGHRGDVRKRPWRSSWIALAGAFFVASAGAGGTTLTKANLCGWFLNPTPGNASLVDRQGEWSISTQGGDEAEGDWPEFKVSQWVRTNGNHGYGCACMHVRAETQSMRIAVIESSTAQSLAVCRRDKSLKAPS